MQKIIRAILFIIAIIGISLDSLALLTEHDIVYRKAELSPQKLTQLQWILDRHDYSYVDKSENLVVVNVDGNVKSVTTLKQINGELNADLKAFPVITWLTHNSFSFQHENYIYMYNTEISDLSKANILHDDAENIAMFSPNRIAYTVGPNLFLALAGQRLQITNSLDDENVLNGHVVHRNEFGIDHGIFWSPKGSFIAYYRMDESMVDDYAFEDYRSFPATIKRFKYPMAGAKSHQVSLVVYDIATQKNIVINTKTAAEEYLTGVTWSSDEKFIIVNILTREQNNLKTIKYDVLTGDESDILFTFETDKYINPVHSYYFQNHNANLALWCSRHDGWNNLFALDTHNRTFTAVTHERRDISNCLGFDDRDEYFFFTAFDNDIPVQHGYSLHLSTGKITGLTRHKDGSHIILPSKDGKFILDIFSSPHVPYQLDIIDYQGNFLRTAYTAKNPLENIDLGNIERVNLKSADGKYDLFGRILYPPNFDENKQYPAIVYVYGGPHVQLVQNTWLMGARLWDIMMTQKGYIVFSLDNRGSNNRGLEFEQETFCRLGSCEVDDQLQGVNYLKTLPYVDNTRLGVFGSSFGGFMATSLMLKTKEFQAGVAGGSVIDWRNYEVMYTERFMKKPYENESGYQQANLLNHVDQLEGALFLISGTHDDVVLPRNTFQFMAEALKHGKKIETAFYPFGAHHFDNASDEDMYGKISKFFDERLLPKTK